MVNRKPDDLTLRQRCRNFSLSRLNPANSIQRPIAGYGGKKRFIAFIFAFLIMLSFAMTPCSTASAYTGGLTLDYHINALKDDHPEITLTVKGAPGETTSLELQTKNFKDIRKAFPNVKVTSSDGKTLEWSWTEKGITVKNAAVRDFKVDYTLNALEWEGGDTKSKSIFFREGYLFFVASDMLLMPGMDPEGITVSFTLPPGHRMYSNLPEKGGVFTAETSLWGSLRYDFSMAYFMGGKPLYDIERATPWGDTYQIVRFERDPMNWSPLLGTTPWEEADRYLDTYQKYYDYIQNNILPPLPDHKVLFADRSHETYDGINGVGLNTDWYHFMQYWGRNQDTDIAHHIIHAWDFQAIYSKLSFKTDSLGGMLREGLPTYYEQTLPAAVSGWDWAPGKLFEFWVLDERGKSSGIQQNFYHQTYNQSAMRLYLLDQYIMQTNGRDLSAFTRALWDEVKDLKAPSDITDTQIRHAFASVVGSGNQGAIDRIAAQTKFSRTDFSALEPSFKLYVDHWAKEEFWDMPLLFIVYLEIAATLGDEWPHYATNPHEISIMGRDAMRRFKEAITPLTSDGLTKEEVLTALSKVTGRQHNGFFEFWAGLGCDLDPNSLLPLNTWTPEGYDDSELVYMPFMLGGTLQTEHYLSGIPQQVTLLLDEPAPADTIEVEVGLRSLDSYLPKAEAEKALSGPNVEFERSLNQKFSNLNKVSGLFNVKTDDPERRRFSFTLTLPSYASNPRFMVVTARDAKGQPVLSGNRQYPPEMAFLHSIDPVSFTAAVDKNGLHLGDVPLKDAYFKVADLKAKPGETVALPAGAGQSLQVDLYDKYGFLRGRLAISNTVPTSAPAQVIPDQKAPAAPDGLPVVLIIAIALIIGACCIVYWRFKRNIRRNKDK